MTVASPPVEANDDSVKRRSPLAETWENLRRSWAGMLGIDPDRAAYSHRVDLPLLDTPGSVGDEC